MKQIKLSGREATVVRAIGFAVPILGSEIQDATRLELEDLTDILNGLMVVGYVEPTPYSDQVVAERVLETEFEVNSAYAHELKTTLRRV